MIRQRHYRGAAVGVMAAGDDEAPRRDCHCGIINTHPLLLLLLSLSLLLLCCCCCCCRPCCLHRSLAPLSPPPPLSPSSPWPIAITLATIVNTLIVVTNTIIAVAAALVDKCCASSPLEEDYCLSPLSGKFPSSPLSLLPLPSLFLFPFCPLGDFDGTSERGQ